MHKGNTRSRSGALGSDGMVIVMAMVICCDGDSDDDDDADVVGFHQGDTQAVQIPFLIKKKKEVVIRIVLVLVK
jgi:hypothetical protein